MKTENIEMFKRLAKAGVQPELLFSEVTEQFYLRTKLMIKNGTFLSVIVEHRNTPDEAIEAYYKALHKHEMIFDGYDADGNAFRKQFCIL